MKIFCKTYNIQNFNVNVVEIDLSNMSLNHDSIHKMKDLKNKRTKYISHVG